MLTQAQKVEIRAKVAEMESTIVPSEHGDDTIGALARDDADLAAELLASDDPLMPILRTALVINWKEVAMVRRYDHFRKTFPHISTLFELKRAMDALDPIAFCKSHLKIDATSDSNPKYRLLRNLVEGFLEYQSALGIATEMAAIRQWAANVDVKNLKDDPIGMRHGVGIGVVENIRRNLGMSVIKPDRHVIGVVRQCLGLQLAPEAYGAFAESLGMEKRRLDFILFKFGQLRNISA